MMLVVSAGAEHTVPWANANASYKKHKRNKGVTEIVKMPGRGHALTIDAGWREVAEKELDFVTAVTKTPARAAQSNGGLRWVFNRPPTTGRRLHQPSRSSMGTPARLH